MLMMMMYVTVLVTEPDSYMLCMKSCLSICLQLDGATDNACDKGCALGCHQIQGRGRFPKRKQTAS